MSKLENYIVGIKEVYEHALQVSATSKEEAIEIAKEQVKAGCEGNFWMCLTLGSDEWNIYKEDNDGIYNLMK